MKIRIVADSSANLKTDLSRSLVSAPLKITVGEKTFVDDENLSVKEMADYLAAYNGKSGSACPGTGEWLEAFGSHAKSKYRSHRRHSNFFHPYKSLRPMF